jgi:hypothetical protein
MRHRSSSLFVLFAVAWSVPGPAADLAVPAALADDPDLGERFAARLARGLQRRRLAAVVLGPDALARLAAPEALLGPLSADAATALREAIDTSFLLRSGIAPGSGLAVAQLYDLRGPWLLGQGSLTAAGPAELLAATDTLAARLAPAWPLEARATLDGDRLTLDRGQVHGFRRRDTIWLLASPERDALGQLARPLAVASVSSVRPRSANAVIQLAGTDLEGVSDLLAVKPVQLAADEPAGLPLGIWLEQAPTGGWRPEFWLDWRRLVEPEIVGGQWRLPGQIVAAAPLPSVEPEPLPADELPVLDPPGPYRVGQPWTLTVPDLPGTVAITLLPPKGGPPSLIVWRGPDQAGAAAVSCLAGPWPGRWTVQIRRWLDPRCWAGEFPLDVLP